MRFRVKNLDGGLNSGVSDFLLQDSEFVAMKNCYSYKIGELTKCPGYIKIDDVVVADKSVNYLHHYYQPSTKNDYMIAGSDNGLNYKLQYREEGNWADITSGSYTGKAGAEIDMENFIDKVFIVGYDNGTFLANSTITATTKATSDETNLTNMAQGKYIVRYKDSLYVLHTYYDSILYPSRVYYSSVPAGGKIEWDPSGDFIEFGYDDGDEITGGAEALDRLIVFKHRSMWKYDNSEKKKIADIGCDSYRSIIKIDQILYWTNRYGAWRWNGGTPELISLKAQSFFDAIDQSKLGEQVAENYNGYEYRVFIGDITVDGYNYINTWFCWDTRRERCYIRCTKSKAKSVCTYIENSKERTYFGNDVGYVYKFANEIDNMYNEDGNEIDSFFITKAMDYGVPEETKFSNHITIFSKYATGMKIAIDVDDKDEFREDNKQIVGNISCLDIGSSGNRFKFKIYEKGSGKSWKFYGFSLETNLKEKEE